jgi:cytochrome d ubiquinol oxidase subunit I
MVGAGVAMAGLALLLIAVYVRRRALPTGRRWLWAIVMASPLGLVAMEAGWLVTEWGRQPWVVRGFLRTADALTPFRPLGPPFYTFTVVYLLLGALVGYLLYRQVRGPQVQPTPEGKDGRA